MYAITILTLILMPTSQPSQLTAAVTFLTFLRCVQETPSFNPGQNTDCPPRILCKAVRMWTPEVQLYKNVAGQAFKQLQQIIHNILVIWPPVISQQTFHNFIEARTCLFFKIIQRILKKIGHSWLYVSRQIQFTDCQTLKTRALWYLKPKGTPHLWHSITSHKGHPSPMTQHHIPQRAPLTHDTASHPTKGTPHTRHSITSHKGHPAPMTQHHIPQTQDSWKNYTHHVQLPLTSSVIQEINCREMQNSSLPL